MESLVNGVKTILFIIVFMLLVLNTTITTSQNMQNIRVIVRYSDLTPVEGAEVIITNKAPLTGCTLNPREQYIIGKYTTDNNGTVYILVPVESPVCLYIKINDTYIDLDKSNAYTNALEIKPNTTSINITLNIRPPQIVSINYSIVITKIESQYAITALTLNKLLLNIVIRDNLLNDVEIKSYLSTGNMSYRLMERSRSLIGPETLNATFTLGGMIKRTDIEQIIDNKSFFKIIVKDSEGFYLTRSIPIESSRVILVVKNSSQANVNTQLSSIAENISASNNETNYEEVEGFTPANISYTRTIKGANIMYNTSLPDIFIPLTGVLTIVLELVRRRGKL